MGTTGQSITLANSIIGVGILAMPFCFQQCGVILASLILLLMGFVSRLCCHFLLKSAIITRRRTFEFLAFHVFGPAGKLAIELGIIGFLMGTCIAYFVVVGDLGPQIIAKMFNINQSDILRTSIMVIVSLVCVLPLGLLKNVDSLSNVSAATICFYFCLVIKVILEATSQLLTSDWHIRIETWKPSGVLQCVPIFSMALFCQTQLFEIFESLPSLSLEKMNLVTKNAINICTAVYFTLGFFGYVAFSSQNISGNILMSLSPTLGSDVIKLGFVMSLAFSFPLIIFPCRASLYSFLYKKVHPAQHDHIINHSIPVTTFRCITVAIIAVALFVSLLLPDIEVVLGLLGSTIGVLICVVFPAACFINVTFKNTNERLLAKVVLVLGLIILVLGTYANLQAAENKYDDKLITQERIDKIVEDFFQKMEKDEGVKPAAVLKSDIITNNVHEKAPKEIIKDSEVQPPNPIPPESHSNEKPPENPIPIDPKLKQVEPEQESKQDAKVIGISGETHPKDLKMKLEEAKLNNGNDKIETNNIEKPKEIVKPESSQEKIDILKKQKLIETIKQHGEEQKELIKEQKEILHKIMKTKKELEKDKKEIDDTEAKKIAVESIQKIANMAIQSLSGVTDKPAAHIDVADRKEEPLQKIANEAVQEIAKKAAETLEAIGEKKAPEANLPKSPDEIKSDQKIQGENVENKPDNINKIISQIHNLHAQNNLPQAVKQNEVNPQPIQQNNKQEQNQPILNKEEQNVKKDIEKPLQNVEDQKNKVNKEHFHSADEPQSYKEGEDSLKRNVASISSMAQNVPLPIALKGNQDDVKSNNIELKPDKQNNLKDINEAIPLNNENKPKIDDVKTQNNQNQNIEPVVSRQKREVIDCTEKTILKPEDKPICEKLISNKNGLTKDVKIDIGLPVNLPLHSNILRRSLKSYKEDVRR
ncbi:Putative sodium-coupled neutral amino acid transporter 10 [Papilio machaon]|uniref:Putative sodium-coupled neutral amino acid transporter 10 n=1 Tax=Papilio machaon TaxID=76193 RepID=A0A194R8Z8_PAPMA|nr:Putative sodium-coupled neutral amino acid transporter 10 [Papilio machaon]